LPRGNAYYAMQAALTDCNQSLALRPNDADTLDSRVITYLKLGQFDNAIADYKCLRSLLRRIARPAPPARGTQARQMDLPPVAQRCASGVSV
jgi:hypothetical protein